MPLLYLMSKYDPETTPKYITILYHPSNLITIRVCTELNTLSYLLLCMDPRRKFYLSLKSQAVKNKVLTPSN